MDIDKEMQFLQSRNLDIQREVSLQLWSNLIVVNGLLLTVLIGLAAFQPPAIMSMKVILVVVIISLVLSSAALVWNLVTTKAIYHRIGEVLNFDNALSEEQKNKDIRSALNGNNRLIKVERFAIAVLILAIILLFVFVWSYLF